MKKIFLVAALGISFFANAQIITDTATLRSRINADIVPNGTRTITAAMLNRILNGYLYNWPNNTIIPVAPLTWNSATRTLGISGWNASNWNTVYSWYLTNPLTGYVPTARTLSINGTTLDLSANRSFTIPNLNFANSDLTFTGPRTHDLGTQSLTLQNGSVIMQTQTAGGSQTTANVFPATFTYTTTNSTIGLSAQLQTSMASGQPGMKAIVNTISQSSSWNLYQDKIDLIPYQGNFKVRALPNSFNSNLRVLLYDTATFFFYHTTMAGLAAMGGYGAGGSGGTTYIIGPGLGQTGTTLYNDLYFKNSYMRNASGAGNPIFIATNDSVNTFRPIQFVGADTTGTDSSHIVVNIGSGGGVLASGDTTGATNIDINLQPFSTYEWVEITFDVKPSGATDALRMRFSSDAGATFDASNDNYYWNRNTDNSSTPTTRAYLEPIVYMSTNWSSMTLKIPRPGATDRRPRVYGFGGDADANGNFTNSTFSGWRNNVQKLDVIRFYNGGGGTLSMNWTITGLHK
jgi:hypothetical protein